MKNNYRFLVKCCSIALLTYGVAPQLATNAQPASNPSIVEQSPTPTTSAGNEASPESISSPTTATPSKPESPSSSSLWSLGTLLLLPLHIVEIWGIIQLFLALKKSQRDQEKNTKTLKDENKKLTEELKGFNKKLQERDAKPKKIEEDLASSIIPSKSTLLFPESLVPQLTEPPINYAEQVSTVPASDYQFLDAYNRNSDRFAQEYDLMVVSEDATNINERRSGDSTDVILSESRNGNYWLVKEADITYLIPRPKVKIQEHNIRTVRGLFDCSTFEPDYHSFTVMQPAIVSVQSMVDGLKWKVEQKGELKFI